jgi:hypothetical protein
MWKRRPNPPRMRVPRGSLHFAAPVAVTIAVVRCPFPPYFANLSAFAEAARVGLKTLG